MQLSFLENVHKKFFSYSVRGSEARFSDTVMMSEWCHNFLIPNFESSGDTLNLFSLLAFSWIKETRCFKLNEKEKYFYH